MATIAIGDIHGNLAALTDLLDQLLPDAVEGDVVVFLGDYVDRGPDAKGCIDAILAFEDRGPARVVALCGNHEDWMLRTMRDPTRHSWFLGMQPLDTIRSYSLEAEGALRKAAGQVGLQLFIGSCELPYHLFFDAMPSGHRAFFKSLLTHYQTPDCICVHAGVHPSFPATDPQFHPRDSLFWGVREFPDAYAGTEVVVYGHHDNAELAADGWPMPKIVGRTVGIDTISHGVLTAMRFPDRRLYQSARYLTSE